MPSGGHHDADEPRFRHHATFPSREYGVAHAGEAAVPRLTGPEGWPSLASLGGLSHDCEGNRPGFEARVPGGFPSPADHYLESKLDLN